MPPSSLSPAFRRWFGQSAVLGPRGRPKVVYHGTTAPEFPAFRAKLNPKEQLGFGIHFAEDPSFASRYAHDQAVVRRKGGPGRVIPVLLSVQRPLLADAIVCEGSPAFALAVELAGKTLFTQRDEAGVRCAYLQAALDRTSPARAERVIRAHGFDGVRYLSQLGEKTAYGMKGIANARSWIVFGPEQIRSALHPEGTGSFARVCSSRTRGSRTKEPDISVEMSSVGKDGIAGDVTFYAKLGEHWVGSLRMILDSIDDLDVVCRAELHAFARDQGADPKSMYRISAVEVDRPYQNKGIGTTLYSDAIRFAAARRRLLVSDSFGVGGATSLDAGHIWDKLLTHFPGMTCQPQGSSDPGFAVYGAPTERP